MTTFWSEELETMSPQVLHQRQLAAFTDLVRTAAGSSSFYGDLLDRSDLERPFDDLVDVAERIPALRKDDIMRLQRADPPYGGLLAVPEERIVRHYVYPAGQVLAWTAGDQRSFEEQFAMGLFASGLRSDDRVNLTFQFGWVAAGTIWDAACRHLGAATSPGGAGESARQALNMRLLRTTAIIGFATFIERIAEAAEEQGIDPASDLDLRTILIVGEWHGSDAKTSLAERFGGAAVREAYGTGEAGLVAAECEADAAAMHVHPDVMLEVRDEHTGDLVQDGSGGELYLTRLGIEGMPFLRYRTGDLTEFVRADPCACGRTTARIGRIVGRAGELLRVKGVFLSEQLIRSVLDDVDRRLGRFVMTVDRPSGQDHLLLQVEGAGRVPDGTAAQAARRLQERGAVAVEVVLTTAEELPRSEKWFIDARAG
jgi:phenylacetate-CoA ligase